MIMKKEACQNCGCTSTTYHDNNGETTCSACGHVVNTTYEPPYDPDRTRNLGKPGGQRFDPAELRRYFMSPRLAIHQNQQQVRIPMFRLVEREIEASPFPSVIKEQG